MNKYSIEVFYDCHDEKGRKLRATAVYQLDALNLTDAYSNAEKTFKDRPDVKFGAILLGWHEKFP